MNYSKPIILDVQGEIDKDNLADYIRNCSNSVDVGDIIEQAKGKSNRQILIRLWDGNLYECSIEDEQIF